jgi:hypothetical protein
VVSRSLVYVTQACGLALGILGNFHLPRNTVTRHALTHWQFRLPIILRIVFVLVVVAVAAYGMLHRPRAEPTGVGGALDHASRFTALLWVMVPAAYFATALILHRQGHELYYFVWYLYEVWPLFAIGIVLFLARAIASRSGASTPRPSDTDGRVRIARIAVPALGLLLGVVVVLPVAAIRPPSGIADEGYSAAQVKAVRFLLKSRRFGTDDRIVSFNSGLLSFLLPNRVINLDGLANDDAARCIESGCNEVEFVRRTGARWLVDVDEQPLSLAPEFHASKIVSFRLGRRASYSIWDLGSSN